MNQQNNDQPSTLGTNFYGHGFINEATENKAKDDDDFEDFEEAKPTQTHGADSKTQTLEVKTNTKEDLLFGGLEHKMKRALGYDSPEPEKPQEDGFGDFEEVKPQQNTNLAHHDQHAEGDDFEDFEEAQAPKESMSAGFSGHNPIINAIKQSSFEPEGKKLTIYDIDLTGIFMSLYNIKYASLFIYKLYLYICG